MSGFSGQGFAGTELRTADANVTAGKPTRVWAIHIISGATPGVVSLRNGILVTDTVFVEHTCFQHLLRPWVHLRLLLIFK